MYFLLFFSPLALIVLYANSVIGQRPKCYEFYKEDPDNIDQVYFPHESNCKFFYQCTAHGAMRLVLFNVVYEKSLVIIYLENPRMKCNPGMHFDRETNQCGRPDDVVC